MPTIRLDFQGNGSAVFSQIFANQKRMEEGQLRIVKAALLGNKVMLQNAKGGGDGMRHAPFAIPSALPVIPPGHHPSGGGGHGGGGHHSWWHSLHNSGRAVGGEFGHLAHRGSALGALAGGSALGLGIAAAGIGLNMLVSSFEHAAESIRAAAERVNEYGDKLFEAGESRGRSGLASAQKEGAGLRQLQNMDLLDTFKQERARGMDVSAENFAALGGSEFRMGAVRSAISFGMTGDAAAEMAKHLSYNGGDPEKAGRGMAQQSFGRAISNDEAYRAHYDFTGSGSNLTNSLDQISSLQGQTANLSVDNISGGVGLAGKQFAQAKDPEGFAMAELQRASERKAAVLDAAGAAAGALSEAFKNAAYKLGLGEGSYGHQAGAERAANDAGMAGN